MDYLVTFEDGSSGYLAHHGVKGMKWGVWNTETKARYSGGSRKEMCIQNRKAKAEEAYYKSGKDSMAKTINRRRYNSLVNKFAPYRGSTKDQKNAANEIEKTINGKGSDSSISDIAKRTESARRERDKIAKPFHDELDSFFHDTKLVEEYGKKAADEHIREWYESRGEKVSDSEREHIRNLFINEDLDQNEKYPGYHSRAFEIYMEGKVKNPEKYFTDVWNAEQKYDKAIIDEVESTLGYYGNRKTKDGNSLDNVTRLRVEAIHNRK